MVIWSARGEQAEFFEFKNTLKRYYLAFRCYEIITSL